MKTMFKALNQFWINMTSILDDNGNFSMLTGIEKVNKYDKWLPNLKF